MIAYLDQLFEQCRPAFRCSTVFERARVLLMSELLCLGRRTITGLLTTCGMQFVDWSASYRLFERARFSPEALFAPVRRAVVERIDSNAPFLVVLDDSLLKKRGRKVSGAGWNHDPQDPPFRHQITWSQRFVEISAILPDQPSGPCQARAVPIDLRLQRRPVRPGRKATEAQHQEYRERWAESSVSRMGVRQLHLLRRSLDDDGQSERLLVVGLDGSYTNKTVFRQVPAHTTVVGRIRKDAKLYRPADPAPSPQRGRKRIYGERLPTPQALLNDKTVPCQTIRAYAAGEIRDFQIKTLDCCRWAAAGERNLRLVVVRPLSKKPHEAGRRLFFAHPGFLICTDPELPLDQILQCYIWRWEIEVGFRDQKTLLGVGQAQTHNRQAVETVPQFQAFGYAALQLAAQACGAGGTMPPRPRWQTTQKTAQRITTQQMISRLRLEMWAHVLGMNNKNGFAQTPPVSTKPQKIENSLYSAVIYAAG